MIKQSNQKGFQAGSEAEISNVNPAIAGLMWLENCSVNQLWMISPEK
jgi:hypothetical protein